MRAFRSAISCWGLPSALYRGGVVGLGLIVLGCGSRSNEDVPPDLLQAIEAADSQSGDDYPAGPYGNRVGDIAADLCVMGWLDPSAAGYDEEQVGPICFSDFWDADASEHQLLVVNTAAVWCTSCATEYGGATNPPFAEEIERRRGAGLRALGTIFQDIRRDPAGVDEAVLWSERFDVDFPFGYDESFAMGAYSHPQLQPFNMVLDTRTMEIVLQLEGFEPESLWPAIDALLER